MAIAGLLAFCFYRLVGWPYGYWAVVTVAAVTRPGLTNTFTKSITRICATVFSAIVGYLILVYCHQNIVLLSALFFIMILIAAFLGLQKSMLNYAGIITGLTLTIVLSTGLISGNFTQAAAFRTLDVLAGILIISLVNLSLRLFFPKKENFKQMIKEQWSQALLQLQDRAHNKILLKWVLCVAITASITFIPWLYFRYEGGFWATISVFFMMEESLAHISRKAWQRFISHVIAASIGGICALLIPTQSWWLLLPILLTFFIFGHIMVSVEKMSLSANTMAIALTVMLLAGTPSFAPMQVVVTRFIYVNLGILIGILVAYFIQKSGRVRQNKVGIQKIN